jgi:hypothetical protein
VVEYLPRKYMVLNSIPSMKERRERERERKREKERERERERERRKKNIRSKEGKKESRIVQVKRLSQDVVALRP